MFLLLPANPGCPGKSPESRKMVVVVVLMLTNCMLQIKERAIEVRYQGTGKNLFNSTT